jgi:deoxyribodipyrimidine photo-lyase
LRRAIVLFTRDLRVHDQPALTTALAAADEVVPLFVFDRHAPPNRAAFLLDALRDLDASLRSRGGALVVRRGDAVAEAMRVAAEVRAEAIFLSEDVSAFAQRRERRLRRERIEVHACPGVTIVPPGDLAPAGGDHFRVFTPYLRRWLAAPRRDVLGAPPRIPVPRLARGRLPSRPHGTSPEIPRGGESEGRRRLDRWLRRRADYARLADDLAADATSRLSPFLHFGCVSPLEVATRARSDEVVRQLAWRDFFAQLLAANPGSSHADLRPRGDRWRCDERALAAWKEGRTGYPLVDAGMRQLQREGFMHNRARLITASFLTKDLYIDWRAGAAHFFHLLVDGDVASNVGNWQWAAGTGADTRPNRIFNPLRQGRRYDPDGDYVRRYVPELASIEGGAVHEPWKHGGAEGYPEPIVDHDEAAARFRRRRRR